MRKWRLGLVLCFMLTGICHQPAAGQIPVADIIKEGIKKIIKAVDLQVQRLQQKTVALQSAQKIMENTMAKWRLREITGWVKKQRDLYGDFYGGLWRVKQVITYYYRVKEITEKQRALVSQYRQAWNRFRRDPHFSSEEINYMTAVYAGILDLSVKNTQRLLSVVQAFTTQMSDAERMAVINEVGDAVDENYDDLHRFNIQNTLLSLSRAKDQTDVRLVQWMYGL